MERTLPDLLSELDTGFLPLGKNDVYTDKDGANARIVIPDMVQDLNMLEFPTKVHLGMSPAQYEGLKDAEEPTENEEDLTIPYLVLAKFDNWLRSPKNDMKHRKMKTLRSNRALGLGVYFVPETSTAKTVAAAPKPHQCSVGETITFWVRPQEWRKRGFLYMIREKFAESLFQVLSMPPDDLLEPATTEEQTAAKATDATTQEETAPAGDVSETGQDDEEIQYDGGWREPRSDINIIDADDADPAVIEDVGLAAEEMSRWGQRGYLLDVSQSRAIDTTVVKDLLGTSNQVQQILTILADEEDYVPQIVKRELARKELAEDDLLHMMLSSLLFHGASPTEDVASTKIVEDISQKISIDDKLSVEDTFLAILSMLEEYDIVEQMEETESERDGESIRLQVRPSAVYAALELAEFEGDMAADSDRGETPHSEEAEEHSRDRGAEEISKSDSPGDEIGSSNSDERSSMPNESTSSLGGRASRPGANTTQLIVQKAIGETSVGTSDRKNAWKEVKARAQNGDEVAFDCVKKVASGEWSVGTSHRKDAIKFLKQLK